jgi:hypothetical protein
MSERPVELQAILTEVRRRWTQRSLLCAWTLGAAAAATVVLAGLGAALLVARDGIPLVVTVGVVFAVAAFAIARALWPCLRTPTDKQLARFVEERVNGLDDVVVTAVDYAARPDASPRMRDVLSADAGRALAALNLDSVVSRDSIRQAAFRAAAATAVLAVAVACFAPSVSRGANITAAHLFPARFVIDVTPGTTKISAGQELTITARLRGLVDEMVPTLTVLVGDESRAVRMLPGTEPGVFTVTIDNVDASFAYRVNVAAARSDDYTITVIRPPRVERIDLHYEFPRGLGLEPRTDEDSGDIYGPAGTKVRLMVTADKAIREAFLLLDDGTKLPLNGREQVLDGALTIDEDGSYRIALADHDGLQSPGDTEYFIRTLDDRPPDVRILRPASDKQVTPLEEVLIEARADDDFGIASFDLVFQSATGKEHVVPLRGMRGGLTASGLHTLFMEDLGVQPGDFVTYYARARDVNRGRRTAEARSDIFFLEVKPFEEEFVAAQSQSMGQGAGQQGSDLQELAEAQKEIIVATWKLDARSRRARDTGSTKDIEAVAKAQSDLRTRAEQASAQAARTSGDPRRRRGQGPAPGGDPLGKAVEAMGRAVNELDQQSTTKALPHEMEALNHLLKAEADVRRRQVSRQQQAGGGGGMNRSEADLSNLFDQELRKRQETNYETPNSTEAREDARQEDPLERIRDLARRQDALNRQQADLMRNRDQLEETELKRQLERLTREQNELRQQAETLAQRMQQQAPRNQQPQSGESQSSQSKSGQASVNGQSGGSSQQESRRLRDISEDMRNAATGMRRQDPSQASESGSRAAQRLRDLEKQMQTARPDDRRRALGDLQLETRQLADAQRRLANEAGRTAPGQAGDDARRRLAGEQERLAERAERLQDQVKQLSRTGQAQGDERNATNDAARELERQKLADRMRQSAEALRQQGGREGQGQPAKPDPSRQTAREGEELARALDRVADRLGAAAGTQDTNSRRLSDSLSKTQELRDKVADLERSIEQLQREGQQQSAGQKPEERADAQGRQQTSSPQGQDSPAPRQGPQQGQAGQQGQSSSGQQSADGRDGSAGQQGGSAGGNGGRVQQLQREVNERMRAAERLAEEIRRDNPGMQVPNNQESWWRSTSAPGTEAFKQDFARWDSLKKNLLVALEGVESKVSSELRANENKERLNAGGHVAVGEAYRDLVDKYYRSLASPRKGGR